MNESTMLTLLAAGDWGAHQPQFDRLAQWVGYPLLLQTLETLQHDALYVSSLHGLGHIERTILQGGFCAMEDDLNEADTHLLLEACAYHDVGRVDDWMDELHGYRSAQRIGALTGRTGEELLLLQGAVDAHSRKDTVLNETLEGYHPADFDRALLLAQLLKDADGLDRVRLGDLEPRFLRRQASRQRADLAQEVYRRYQTSLGLPPTPYFTEEQLAFVRKHRDDTVPPPKPET
jgi:hypothetical protein